MVIGSEGSFQVMPTISFILTEAELEVLREGETLAKEVSDDNHSEFWVKLSSNIQTPSDSGDESIDKPDNL